MASTQQIKARIKSVRIRVKSQETRVKSFLAPATHVSCLMTHDSNPGGAN